MPTVLCRLPSRSLTSGGRREHTQERQRPSLLGPRKAHHHCHHDPTQPRATRRAFSAGESAISIVPSEARSGCPSAVPAFHRSPDPHTFRLAQTSQQSFSPVFVSSKCTGSSRRLRYECGAGFNDRRSTRLSARAASESRMRPRIRS